MNQQELRRRARFNINYRSMKNLRNGARSHPPSICKHCGTPYEDLLTMITHVAAETAPPLGKTLSPPLRPRVHGLTSERRFLQLPALPLGDQVTEPVEALARAMIIGFDRLANDPDEANYLKKWTRPSPRREREDLRTAVNSPLPADSRSAENESSQPPNL